MAPRLMAPRKAVGYATQFGRRMSTRAPAGQPRSRRSWAKRLVRSARSAHLTPPSFTPSPATITPPRSPPALPPVASDDHRRAIRHRGSEVRVGARDPDVEALGDVPAPGRKRLHVT